MGNCTSTALNDLVITSEERQKKFNVSGDGMMCPPFYNESTNTLYKIKVNPPTSLNEINIVQKLWSNDSISVYEAHMPVSCILHITKDVDKPRSEFKLIKVVETYAEYLDRLHKIPEGNYRWVWNIFDGIDEQNRIIYQDESIVILPDYKWDYDDSRPGSITAMHLLVLFNRIKSDTDDADHGRITSYLCSIRDLRAEHLNLLRKTKETLERVVFERYGVEANRLRLSFHYSPTVWILHLHITQLSHRGIYMGCEKAFNLEDIIQKLEIDSLYFTRDMTTNIRLDS